MKPRGRTRGGQYNGRRESGYHDGDEEIKNGGGGAPRIHPGHDEEERSRGERGVIYHQRDDEDPWAGTQAPSKRASVEMSSSACLTRRRRLGLLLLEGFFAMGREGEGDVPTAYRAIRSNKCNQKAHIGPINHIWQNLLRE